jgi:DNA phosphorothioation-dependent restriction protein DptG
MFQILEEKYNNTFYPTTKGFQHSSGKTAIFFPFATDTTGINDTKSTLKDFKSISAAIHRSWTNTEIHLPDLTEEIIEGIIESVSTEEKSQLKDIIKKLIFDSKGNLVIFQKSIIPFIKRSEKNAKISNLITFLFHLFDGPDFSYKVNDCLLNEGSSNTLYTLVSNYLNNKIVETKNQIGKRPYFDGEISKQLRELFQRDYLLLSENENLFKKHLHQLFKYYYYSYIQLLAIEFNESITNTSNTKLFFSLEWEKLSQSRLAVDNGYKKLETIVIDIFSHSNCLEMLNTIDFSEKLPNQIVTYKDIISLYESCSENEILDLEASLHKLLKQYLKLISQVEAKKGGFDWETESAIAALQTNSDSQDPQSLKILKQLFYAMRYQFEKSGRKGANTDFSTWYKTFVQLNFVKTRGRLGNTLSLRKDYLLLFTELAILNTGKDKILLTTLWEELETRGIHLDNQSKHEATQYFQKINALEKKSDSGDAQYVTKMHK